MVGEGVESRVPYYSVFTAPDREVLPRRRVVEGREIESGEAIFNDAVNSLSKIRGQRERLSNMEPNFIVL